MAKILDIYTFIYDLNKFIVYILFQSYLKLSSHSLHRSQPYAWTQLGSINGKFFIKNALSSLTVNPPITNLNIYLKSSNTKYLKLFKKYFNLFSQPFTPKSLISSLNEADLSLPIYMKSYYLNDIKFIEYCNLC